MNKSTTVFVVDDDDAVRMSLEAMLTASGYQTRIFDSGAAFLESQRDCDAGCIVLDVRMPTISGLEVLKILKQEACRLPVIIMTGHGDIKMAIQAMKDGAFEFIEKPFSKETILGAIESAASAVPMNESVTPKDPALLRKIDRLTPREREVLDHLVIGNLNKVIAFELDISPRTVEVHRARVMEKMKATSLSQLVRMAIAAGLAPPTL